MKKRFLLALVFVFALSGCSSHQTPIKAKATVKKMPAPKMIGAAQWTKYRLNNENNPVITSTIPLKLNTVLKSDDDMIMSTPVVADNKLFIGNTPSGSIQAFDLTNGKLLWKTIAPNWIHSETLYQDGKIYVGYGNRMYAKRNIVRGTGSSGVLCINANTGDTLWNFSTKGEVMPTPVLYHNQVIVAGGDRVLHVLDQNTGKQVWSLPIGSVDSMSSPSEDNGILYFGGTEPYKFFAIDLNEHKILWSNTLLKEYGTPKVIAGLDDVPPVISGNLVITTAVIGTYRNYDHPTQMIYAMNKQTGKIEWKQSLGNGKMVFDNKSGAPILYKGNVYVASPITKKMYAFNATTGKELWEKQNDAVLKAPPVATNNIVYFADTKGRIIGLDYQTGMVKGQKQLHGILAPEGPIIVDNEMVVGSQDSNVYIFPLSEVK